MERQCYTHVGVAGFQSTQLAYPKTEIIKGSFTVYIVLVYYHGDIDLFDKYDHCLVSLPRELYTGRRHEHNLCTSSRPRKLFPKSDEATIVIHAICYQIPYEKFSSMKDCRDRQKSAELVTAPQVDRIDGIFHCILYIPHLYNEP